MIGGAILLGAELGFVNAQFYLVFIGAAALVVGVASAAIPGLAPDAQWTAFAILAVLSMVLFRSRLYRRLRGHGPAVRCGPAGGVLTLPEALEPGQQLPGRARRHVLDRAQRQRAADVGRRSGARQSAFRD